jgi:hypothetical protein
MKKKLLLTGIMTALLLSFTASNAQTVGEKAPDFSYTDLGGTTHTLAQYAGRVVFIYTFGSGFNTTEVIVPYFAFIGILIGSANEFKCQQ